MSSARSRNDVAGAFLLGQLWPRDMDLDAAQKMWLRLQPLAIRAPIEVQQKTDELLDRYQGALALTNEAESQELVTAVNARASYSLSSRLARKRWDEEIASEKAGQLTVAKLDVDANPATARDFQVVSIPTMILFKGGRPVKRIVGAKGKAALLRELADVV